MKLKGIEPLELRQKFWDRMKHPQIAQPWLEHDLMRQYRYCATFGNSCDIIDLQCDILDIIVQRRNHFCTAAELLKSAQLR